MCRIFWAWCVSTFAQIRFDFEDFQEFGNHRVSPTGNPNSGQILNMWEEGPRHPRIFTTASLAATSAYDNQNAKCAHTPAQNTLKTCCAQNTSKMQTRDDNIHAYPC